VRVLPGSNTNVRLDASAPATLFGRVTRAGAPAAFLPLSTQRSDPPTNLSWSAATDADGRFEFEPLVAGSYRIWSSQLFVTNVVLIAGELDELVIDLAGTSTEVEFRAEGVELDGLESARVCQLGVTPEVYTMLRRVGPGRFSGPLPSGRLLFALEVAGFSVGDALVAVSDAAAGAAHVVVDLPATGIALHGAPGSAVAPPPVARLVSIGGHAHLSSWGTPFALAESATDGELQWRFVPAGALVELDGVGASGGRHTVTVRVGELGLTRVTW